MILPILIKMQVNLFEIIKQVFTSWQVLVVTLIILLYIHIVSYASKKHYPKRRPMKTPKIKKKEVETAVSSDNDSGSSSNDELGLEEA